MTTLSPTNPPSASPPELPSDSPVHALRAALRKACAQARRVLLVRAGAKVLSATVCTLIALILIDYLLRFPAPLRWALLACAIALIVQLVRRWWGIAWSIRPTPTDLALRLEPLAGEGWTGRLASGLELAEPDPRDTEPAAVAMRAAAVHRAVRGFDPRLTARAINRAPAVRWGSAACATLAFALLLIAWRPGLAETGLQRTLMPWTDAKWPRRQIVEHVPGAEVLPIDRAVPLRALVTTTNRAEGETPVWAEHRLVVNGQAQPWERVRLTPQNATPEQSQRGELYERLVEPVLPSAASDESAIEGSVVMLEYRLETEDDFVRRRAVRLVYPPRVVDGDLSVQLPEYASALEASERFLSGPVELGDGNDARNAVGPVLAGSALELHLSFNKPVSITGIRALLERFDHENTLTIETDEDSTGATIRGVLHEPALLPLTLTDEHGIRTRGEPAYRVDVVEDLPPSIAVVVPERDEDVLPTAVIDLLARGEDDLALRTVSLVADIVRIDASAETEAGDRGQVLASVVVEDATIAEADATLQLTPLGLVPGDEVRVTAIASDAYTDPEGTPRDEVRSRARTLRIISETTLINQLRSELAGLRRAAMRLDEQQAAVEARTRETGEETTDPGESATADELAQEQDDIASRLAQQRQAAQRLAERLDRNELEDDTLRELLEQGEDLLEDAQEAADEAAERLARDDREGAEEQQREVRDEIARLVALLDRGEDSWLARQGLQRLLDEQRDIQEATAQMQEQTLGRETEQLTEDERSELQKIADRQRAAARRAEEAIDELENAAERMQERDPAQAAALEEAAATARRARLPARLDAAAGKIGENQTQQAQQQQQQAIDDMQQALDQLDEGDRLRDEALRRVLASLVETLEILVDDQSFELANLDNADAAGRDVAPLAPAMLNLQQRTLDATAQAASAGSDLAVVTDRLDRAQTAQGKAINALRAEGAQADRVRPFERTALEHLEAALEEAQQAEEDAAGRAAQREQDELRQAYTDFAARQRELITQTEPLIERQLSRRERAEARAVATSQDELALGLAQLEQDHPAITESPVFRLAHERVARLSERVAQSLREGTPGARDTLTQDSIAVLLEQLASSLENLPPPEEGFEQDSASNQGGGGGGSGGGEDPPAIPPIAELVVLRTLQDQAARATELADATGDPVDLDDAVSIQRAVAEEAQTLLESLQSDQNPPPDGLPIGPDTEIPNNEPDSGDSTGGETDGSDAP